MRQIDTGCATDSATCHPSVARFTRRGIPSQTLRMVNVRLLQDVDRDQWLALWQAYNAFYGRSGSAALPDEVTDTLWRRFLDPAEPVHAVVAEHARGLVGFAHYLFHRSTTLVADTCYLQDVFTAPDFRRQGVGRALIDSVRDRAKAAGSPRLYWQTHESNAEAMRLYDKIAERPGFVIYRMVLG